MRAVRYDRFTGIDGLDLVERPDPIASAGTAIVRILSAGINPATLSALQGASYVPGRDFAGEVVAVGKGVHEVVIGDPVLGRVQDWWAHAELVAVPAEQLLRRPAGLSWDVAGCLYTPAMAGLASVKAVAPGPDDLIVVSGASGGVGLTAAQLARQAGASVIGLAGADKASWLTAHGITAVTYGEGERERIRAAAGGRQVDGFIDAGGSGYVALALDLGVAAERINTVVDFGAAKESGAQTRGTQDAGGMAAFEELAGLAASGTLEFPIAAAYPLAEVREAYRTVARRRLFGRIVLHPQQ
jgi:NADPH:quinone reductase